MDREPRLSLRALGEADLAMVHTWRNRPHVARWFHGPISRGEVHRKYLARISGEEPVHVLVIEVDDRPAGIIQHYRVGDSAHFPDRLVDADAHGIDLFIGEPELVGRGLGTRALETLVSRLLERDDVSSCVIDPEAENAAALRSYEKAGFAAIGERRDVRDGARRVVMERRRPGVSAPG